MMNFRFLVSVLAVQIFSGLVHAQCLQFFPLAAPSVPGDPPAGPNGTVNALLLRANGDLVVAGAFTQAGGVNANRLAVWNGAQRSALGAGFDDSVSALAQLPNGDIVAGGVFLNADGSPATRLARWNGSTWAPLGSGLDGAVKSLAVRPNGDLYAAGVFSNSGTVPTLRIARWNGSAWDAVGNGTDEYDLDVLANSPTGDLIVGGFLHSANVGSVPALKIARWDGSQWFRLGAGLNFGVYAISNAPNGDIIAAGAFTGFGNSTPGTANHVARWNGSSWQALGLGVGAQPYAVLALPNGEVVLGGNFEAINIQPNGSPLIRTTGVARWDGSMWQPISTGMNGAVYALTLLNQHGDFIAAGSFTIAGGRAATRLAVCRSVAGSPPGITSVVGTCAASRYRPLTLSVNAHSAPGVAEPLIYQWRRNGLFLSDANSLYPSHQIIGTSTSTLVIRPPTASDNGSYDVIASDAGGCTTSASVAFTYCPGDFDCSGAVTIDDLFGFLHAWLANDPVADFDANQTLSISDIYSYIGAWFSGCS